MPHELPIPPVAIDDERSVEMIRLWIARQKLHCVLNIGFWEEREIDERDAWGVLLADMIRHITDAHQHEYGRDAAESITRIRTAFEAEMESPTSRRTGEFLAARKCPDGD